MSGEHVALAPLETAEGTERTVSQRRNEETDRSVDVKSLATTLKDRFGLELKEDRRELDVLVVDRVEPLGK